MKESDINTIIGHSLSWAFKPPDGPTLKGYNPFDGFGALRGDINSQGFPVYWEAKHLKKPMSFNFNHLKSHQIQNLVSLKEILPNSLTLFCICVTYKRTEHRLYIFRDPHYILMRKQEKRNILKKEFDARRNYLLIKKKYIDFSSLLYMPMEWEYEGDNEYIP